MLRWHILFCPPCRSPSDRPATLQGSDWEGRSRTNPGIVGRRGIFSSDSLASAAGTVGIGPRPGAMSQIPLAPDNEAPARSAAFERTHARLHRTAYRTPDGTVNRITAINSLSIDRNRVNAVSPAAIEGAMHAMFTIYFRMTRETSGRRRAVGQRRQVGRRRPPSNTHRPLPLQRHETATSRERK